MRNNGLKLLCLGLLLAGCSTTREPIVRTETVTVEVPVFVALPDALTAPVAEPERPALTVTDATGKPTITNEALLRWLEDWCEALRAANARLGEIRVRQPGVRNDP